jgi:Domain of unknown function (DUF4440)
MRTGEGTVPATGTDDRQAVTQLLRRINDAWLKGNPDDIERTLEACFHDDIVIKSPRFEPLAKGKRACIASYVDFIRQAEIHDYRLDDPAIDLYGATAVATYLWEINYALDGVDYRESGHDLFVLIRADGRWQAVWRAISPTRSGRAKGQTPASESE